MVAPAKKAKLNPATLPAVKITEGTLVMRLSIGKFGTRRAVSNDVVEVDADDDMIHVGKEILKAGSLRAIRKHGRHLKQFLKRRAIPNPVTGSGSYLLPLELVVDTDQRCDEFIAKWEAACKVFFEEYPDLVKGAKARLRDAYDPDDYPPLEEVKRAFYITRNYTVLDTPGSLKELNRDLYERERQRSETMWANAQTEIRDALRVAFAQMVGTMADRLKVTDGKKKRFGTATMDRLSEFLTTFEARNIMDDAELKALVTKARAVLKGADAETLRNNDGLREKVQVSFAKITEEMKPMVAGRKIRFTNEDEE